MAEAVTSDAYRRRVARHMAGNSSLPPIAFIAFGDGGHKADLTAIAPDPAASALKHEILRKPLALITQEDGYSVTGKGVIDKTELVGARISEAALLDADGQICGLKTFAPKLKESDERYEISIRLRF